MLEKPSISAIDTTDDLQKQLILIIEQTNANTEALKALKRVSKKQQRISSGLLSLFKKKKEGENED